MKHEVKEGEEVCGGGVSRIYPCGMCFCMCVCVCVCACVRVSVCAVVRMCVSSGVGWWCESGDEDVGGDLGGGARKDGEQL